ncbi:MAG: hypothetical protein WBI63_00115, partial [Coriobacteriia bacterium]
MIARIDLGVLEIDLTGAFLGEATRRVAHLCYGVTIGLFVVLRGRIWCSVCSQAGTSKSSGGEWLDEGDLRRHR